MSFAAVCDVTQCSPKETAAHISIRLFSRSIKTTNNINKLSMTKIIHWDFNWEVFRVFFAFGYPQELERVFIFGNSTHNFVEIIRSSLDFDITCYASGKLLTCKAVSTKQQVSPNGALLPCLVSLKENNLFHLNGIYFFTSINTCIAYDLIRFPRSVVSFRSL